MAHVGMSIVEYFQVRRYNARARYRDGSRLFVYKITRNLMGVTGDTGVFKID